VSVNNDFDERFSAAEVSRTLEQDGIHLLVNQAVRAGPLAISGRDARLRIRPKRLRQIRASAYQALARTPGVKLLIVHRPDEFEFTPGFINVVLAGHTHCGQVVLPIVGALLTGSDFGSKYLCGVYRKGSKLLVVTAGLGTSKLPLRIGAPPDIWLIEVRRAASGSRKAAE
jgi:hypothetical protein